MNKLLSRSYLALLYVFLYLPIFIVIIFSFNNTAHSLVWHGVTTHWYHLLVQDKDMVTVAWHSLVIALISSTLATTLGLLAAITLYRYFFAGKQFFSGLLFTLIIIPDLVLGIALLLFYRITNFPVGFFSLLIAHITFSAPFACVIISSQMQSLNKNLFEAAKDLGASETVLFFKIILPLLLPGIISGWLLAFTLSIDDVVISYFVSGPSFEILPLKIYSMVKLGVSPEINALSTLLFILTLGIALTSHRLLRKKP